MSKLLCYTLTRRIGFGLIRWLGGGQVIDFHEKYYGNIWRLERDPNSEYVDAYLGRVVDSFSVLVNEVPQDFSGCHTHWGNPTLSDARGDDYLQENKKQLDWLEKLDIEIPKTRKTDEKI